MKLNTALFVLAMAAGPAFSVPFEAGLSNRAKINSTSSGNTSVSHHHVGTTVKDGNNNATDIQNGSKNATLAGGRDSTYHHTGNSTLASTINGTMATVNSTIGAVNGSVGNNKTSSKVTSSDGKNSTAPSWAISTCKALGSKICSFVDGVPKLNVQQKQQSKRDGSPAVNGTGTPNQSNTTTGIDGNPNDSYSVVLDPTYVATGLCNPSVFMDLMWNLSCPVGNNQLSCGGYKTWDCQYHEDRTGDILPAADLNVTPRKQVKQCTMRYQAFFDSNSPYQGVQNHTLADFIKRSTVKMYQALMDQDGGTIHGQLYPKDEEGPGEQNLPDVDTYKVPSRMLVFGTQGHQDTAQNGGHFLQVITEIDCPAPNDSLSCSKLAGISSAFLGILGAMVPAIAAPLSIGSSVTSIAANAACPS